MGGVRAAPYLLLAVTLVVSDLAVVGCTRKGAAAQGGPGSVAEAVATESEVIQVAPMVALKEPTQANLELVPTGEGTSEFRIAEESGQVYWGEVTTADDATAEGLGLDLPEGAMRLAGAQVDGLASTNPMVDPSLSGSLAVVYECPQPVREVVAFYGEHASGRYEEIEEALLTQAGWRLILDKQTGSYIGVTETDHGVTQITLLDTPEEP